MMNLRFHKAKAADLFFTPDAAFSKDNFEGDELVQEKLNVRCKKYALEIITQDIISTFLDKNPNYRTLVNLNRQKQRLNERICILNAHGEEEEDEGFWMFHSKDKSYSVQKWIDKNDGKYSALLLCCCNPNHYEIYSKKSVVIAPNENYSGINLDLGNVQIEPYLPRIGYVNTYEEEAIIRDMRKELK